MNRGQSQYSQRGRMMRAAKRHAMQKCRAGQTRSASATRPLPFASHRPAAAPTHSAASHSFPAKPFAAPIAPRPVVVETELARDQRYFIGARRVYFATLGLLLLLLWVPPTSGLSALCLLLGACLFAELLLCIVYRAQLRRSEDQALNTAVDEEAEQHWQDWITQHPPVADTPAAEVPPIMKLGNTILELRGSQPVSISAARQIPPTTPRLPKPMMPKTVRQRQLEDEARLDYELSWRRDVKHGNPTDEMRQHEQQRHQAEAAKQQQAELEEERYSHQELKAIEQGILEPDHKERQLQELEMKVRQGLVR